MKTKTSMSLIVATVGVAMVVGLMLWRNASVEAVYPVEKAARLGKVTLRERWRAFRRANSVVKENARLRREVEMLSLVQGDLERSETENARLRRALEYPAKVAGKWVAAEVLADGIGAFGNARALRVAKGTSAGVQIGAVVVSGDGLVGRVSAVTPHTATVMPITDRSVQVGCEVENSAMRAVTAGARDGMIELAHTRGGGPMPPRSRVVTSGLGGVFPKGIEIGVLIDGAVLPSVDFEALEDVFIRCEK